MEMIATGRELIVTKEKRGKAFTLRMSPSYRAFGWRRTLKHGEPEQWAIKTAEAVAKGLKKIEERGHLTKKERDWTIIPDALYFSELPPVKYRGKVVYTHTIQENGLDRA